MTNAERINEELLEWLDGLSFACMDYVFELCKGYETCRECWKDWLRSSANNTQVNHHAN